MRDSDATRVIGPAPGGRPAWDQPAAVETAPPYDPTGAVPVAGTPGRGPLVECAFGLLSTAPLLRAPTPPAAPEQLRDRVESELRAFEECARAKGVDERVVAGGAYALCALIDDVVLNTPWGAHGTWRSNGLVVGRYHDAAAGEHFFDRLDEAKRQPERSRPLLELMAACLALGFEGRYRIVPHGQLALRQIRNDLLALLRRLDGEDDGALSGHWRGAAAAHVPVARRIPFWVYASAAAGMLVLVYAAFVTRLGDIGGRLDVVVAGLPPAGPVGIVRQTPAPPPPPPDPAAALEPRLRACLPEPARNGPEAVAEHPQGLRIRLPNAGLFASSSAELKSAVEPVITCLAGVLKGVEGRVLVVGHSDNIRIRTARFPDNWELSKARAEAVAAVARPVLGEGRVEVAGRSDTEPVASNTTEDGRGRNRRVEVLLLR